MLSASQHVKQQKAIKMPPFNMKLIRKEKHVFVLPPQMRYTECNWWSIWQHWQAAAVFNNRNVHKFKRVRNDRKSGRERALPYCRSLRRPLCINMRATYWTIIVFTAVERTKLEHKICVYVCVCVGGSERASEKERCVGISTKCSVRASAVTLYG